MKSPRLPERFSGFLRPAALHEDPQHSEEQKCQRGGFRDAGALVQAHPEVSVRVEAVVPNVAAGAGKIQLRKVQAVQRGGVRGEVEGLLGRVEVPVKVIESEAELEDFLKTADRSKPYACLSQTTLNAADVERMTARLKAALPEVTAASEVCHATRERQAAVKELAKSCPVILVVGSARSSNTRRLDETALGQGVRAHLLGSAAEFRPEWLEGVSRVGITSGASAPEELVRELCDRIHLTQKEE